MPGSDYILNPLSGDNGEAFHALYHEYWADMYKSAYSILKDREQCMDIIQEIFTWLWEHRNELVIRTSIRAYLLAAVKFKAANVIRHGKVRRNFFTQIAAIQTEPVAYTTEELLEVKELEAFIRQAVDGLPEKCRTIYELSRTEHLSHREIANELDISIKTVENQMNIALRRLRVIITKMFFLMLFCLMLNAERLTRNIVSRKDAKAQYSNTLFRNQ